jgi:protein phosphatase
MVRKNNEDSYAFEPPHLFVVADGMGGHLAGEIASKLAVRCITEYVEKYGGENKPDTMLAEAIQAANRVIYKQAAQHNNYAGMGTTVSAVYLEADKIYWGHVGDSRIYLLKSGEETLHQLTADHSLVWELVERGELTPEEASNHPRRNVLTRAVGIGENITIDTGIEAWGKGDILFLCTDGLSNMIDESDLISFLKEGNYNGEFAVERLIAKANDSGGFDNITAILVQNGA